MTNLSSSHTLIRMKGLKYSSNLTRLHQIGQLKVKRKDCPDTLSSSKKLKTDRVEIFNWQIPKPTAKRSQEKQSAWEKMARRMRWLRTAYRHTCQARGEAYPLCYELRSLRLPQVAHTILHACGCTPELNRVQIRSCCYWPAA